MDRSDRKILDLLVRDARLTSEQLGEKVGLSPSAAHRRVKALETTGMIRGYRAHLSRAARGNPATIFVQITLADQRQATMMAFEKAIERTRQISETWLLGGESDYLVKLQIPEGDSYERVHREILSVLPGVHRLVTHLTLKTLPAED